LRHHWLDSGTQSVSIFADHPARIVREAQEYQHPQDDSNARGLRRYWRPVPAVPDPSAGLLGARRGTTVDITYINMPGINVGFVGPWLFGSVKSDNGSMTAGTYVPVDLPDLNVPLIVKLLSVRVLRVGFDSLTWR
jgi:hypothetical protein